MLQVTIDFADLIKVLNQLTCDREIISVALNESHKSFHSGVFSRQVSEEVVSNCRQVS